MKRKKNNGVFLLWVLSALFLSPTGILSGQDTLDLSKASEQPAPQSDLDKLKLEWEDVREQQVKMILEKEAQLEKLKEEIFAKMKTQGGPVVSSGGPEPEAEKASLQNERQKFFAEMNRQKESLRRLQASLDEKTKQLEAERKRFEQEKKTAAR
jgi:N-methylhydantoinase A/oxoprolinase/acetone carboxylase beta subunit